MLRVGLTGGLGSGKSTVGRILSELGAAVIDADEVGRKLMQPGEAVYDRIVETFGAAVVRQDGSLDRRLLAELAFGDDRVSAERRQQLNRIVHPATIAAQEQWMRGVFAADPDAVAIVESALIFEASGGIENASGQAGAAASLPGWKDRFDRILLVTAPEELKIRRFVERSLARAGGDPELLEADARNRLAAQIPDENKVPFSDWVIENSGEIAALRASVADIYQQLHESRSSSGRFQE